MSTPYNNTMEEEDIAAILNTQSRKAAKNFDEFLKPKHPYLKSAANVFKRTNNEANALARKAAEAAEERRIANANAKVREAAEELRIAETNAKSREAAAKFEAFLNPTLSLEEAGTGLHVKGGKRRRRTQRKQRKRRKSRKSY